MAAAMTRRRHEHAIHDEDHAMGPREEGLPSARRAPGRIAGAASVLSSGRNGDGEAPAVVRRGTDVALEQALECAGPRRAARREALASVEAGREHEHDRLPARVLCQCVAETAAAW